MTHGETREAAPITVTHAGRRYRIERTDGHAPGTVVERFPGVGLIGSLREWRGSTWTKGATWYAAVTPTGRPGGATATADRLPSRRAAVAWLIEHGPQR